MSVGSERKRTQRLAIKTRHQSAQFNMFLTLNKRKSVGFRTKQTNNNLEIVLQPMHSVTTLASWITPIQIFRER
jgi:hypothetical protein